MHLKILGSAAGGGFPQWNCACPNCRLVRDGVAAYKRRSQTQVAVSSDGKSWFLLGASPDLRSQIEGCSELRPSDAVRSSPVAGVVLANADLDHTLGLLLLRELQPFQVYATHSVIQILRNQNSMFRMLNRLPDQVRWQAIRPEVSFPLHTPKGEETGISCRPVPLPWRYPPYVEDSGLDSQEAVLGLILTTDSGASLAYFPGVASLSEQLRQQLGKADIVLFDGTFYSDDELIRVQGSGQRAREMGHIPVGGPEGSLRELAGLTTSRKLYIHINNTNPMLNQAGQEYAAVREAGWEIAEDGWGITL